MDDREAAEINRKEAERVQRIGNANTTAQMFVTPVIGLLVLGASWEHMTSAMEACATIALVVVTGGVAAVLGMRRDWG